jgi:hypothetical protein
MAKFTETFIDWINNGNDFPSSFDVETFPNLKNRFFARYCDCEIGFETENLFKIKFEAVADSKIPLYVSAVKALATSDANVADPIKKSSNKNGKTRATTTELPFNATSSSPSSIMEADEFTNGSESSGYTLAEAIAQSDWNEKIRDMEERLINEFENLFMKVY